MVRKILHTLFSIAAFVSSFAWAGVSPDQQREVQYLLDFVSESACTFERNGSLHTAREAAEHIEKKYRYFQDEIDSAERFIELAATKSSLSGRYYTVRCPNHPEMRSADWLLLELRRYRDSGAGK